MFGSSAYALISSSIGEIERLLSLHSSSSFRSAERGLLIMLDNHRITAGGGISELWYNNEYPESEVISLWQSLVTRYKDRWNFFAVDLKNEPHDSASWGNSNAASDWNKAAERIINSLSSFSGLFFVEGIEWGNRLENVAQFPINTGNTALNNRVVYSPHCYGPSVYDRPEFNTPNFPNNLDAIYMAKYGFIVNQTNQPVVVGEWGGRAEVGTRDATWNNWYVEWLRSKCLTNNFYWCLNPNSGDTGGLLEDDWLTPIPRKVALTTRAQPNPTKFEARNGQICITPGSFPETQCQVGGVPTGAPASTTTMAASGGSTTTTPGQGPSSTTTASSGGGGVTATAIIVNQWEENGSPVKQYKLRISNGSSSQVCAVQVKLNAIRIYPSISFEKKRNSEDNTYWLQSLKDKWNLEEISYDLYRTPAWMRIAPGDSAEQAGYIAYGDSTPTIVSVQNC
ncbi:hypothetical protein PMAYCL1PPCAC_18940 [Pristionchus mayeri]|uniref:Glycoside hydrolase family 5 domain-containing protein n=1 Tax=Pristionchus mayeri TaxID=1317129 RepID=A0AAN5CQV1_9BILA|nr:hypothetical protein PMAYCL1PPCAC_18940 [Pristionchus mayeri]